ncbi:MAG: hypothetical protein AB8H79_08465 [Myxococcota bacterium]
MRTLPFVFLISPVACTGSEPATDPVTDATDGTDVTDDTDPPIELPFDVGAWTVDFLDPEIDLCGHGALRPQVVTFRAGGSAFEVVMDGPSQQPLTFDCSIDEMAYACEAPGEFQLSGSFLAADRAFGDFVDDSCGSYFPFSAEKN